jgi:hypothetical protein
MWNKIKTERKVVKFEFGGNVMTRVFFPLLLLYFVAIAKFSFRFYKSMNRK